MERSLITKFNGLKLIICVFLLLGFNGTYAASGCCSHHGGVKGCNTATNHDLCNDGTTSPSCLCSGGTTQTPPNKSKTTKKAPATPAATTSSTTTTTTAPAATTITTTTPAATTSSTTTTTKKTKGCCSKHGGAAGCDATGFTKCKDGTVSATCKC